MIWFLENPARSKHERLELEQLAGSVDWLVPIGWRMDSSRLSWDADILVGEQVYSITLRYPNHFPFSPPLVLPRGDQRRWSSHQYGAGGELCLEYGPDNWHQDVTGAEMVRSAHRLLMGEVEVSSGGPELPSRHRTTLGERLRGKRRRFYLDPEAQAVLSSLVEGQVVQATTLVVFQSPGSTRYLQSAEIGSPGWKAILAEPLVRLGYSSPAVLMRWPELTELPSTASASQMCSEIATQGMDIGDAELLVFIHGYFINVFELNREVDSVATISVISEDETKRRLDPSHEFLKERKVAVIGCGSMGSKVATMLARSGVSQFVLVDGDVLLGENLVRNDLDLREVGSDKVDGVASRIQLVNPRAVCDKHKRSLGGQASSSAIEGLIEVLGTCDLLLDCTAAASAFDVLSAVSSFSKRAIVWGEVFTGGIGGLIARSRPGREPNSSSVRRSIEAWCDEKGTTIARATAPYDGGEAEPAIANDAEVSIIASHLAALAIDTLLGKEPSSYTHAAYLIGLQAAWIFDQAFETYPIDVGPPETEAQVAVDPEEWKAEILEIVKRLNEHPDATTLEPGNS
jgi:sulfur-carrier protein adenylyltransferase/sulfurtransferase